MKLLKVPEVVALTGLSRWTIHRLEMKNQFPPRYRVGGGVAWNRDDIINWIDKPSFVKDTKSKQWVRK